jgi:hypothetical protein
MRADINQRIDQERQQRQQQAYWQDYHQVIQNEVAPIAMQAINTVSAGYEQKHRDSLKDWQPFASKDENERLHTPA